MIIKFFEDTGPISGTRGTTITEDTNINWKSSGIVTDLYWMYPLRRPAIPDITPKYTVEENQWIMSYTKYVSFKIEGDCTKIKNLKITLDNVPGLRTKLFANWKSTYAAPTDAFDGTLNYIEGPREWYVPLSTVSPAGPHTFQTSYSGNGLALYTPFFVTQLHVINSSYNDVGNTTQIKLKFSLEDYER